VPESPRCVVDQQFDSRAQPFESRGEPVAVLGDRQVGADRDRPLLTAQRLRRPREPFFAPSDQRDPVSRCESYRANRSPIPDEAPVTSATESASGAGSPIS